jgi:phosphoribosylamine--glycine ligase
MRVLVVGGGAREHALALRLAGEPRVTRIVCAPGNPGMAQVGDIRAVDLGNPEAVLALADAERVDLTVVGPEAPLSQGLADCFNARGRMIVGPSAAAARLESSKAFAKDFMLRHGVPTARYRTCASADEATTIVRSGSFGFPIVLKADGLAAGKGVVIADDRVAAEAAITAAMRDRRYGSAGDLIVIEECLRGPEVSFFVVVDGERATFIGSAQDHKRILDGDRGPNTGGMGAFAPSPLMSAALQARVMQEIVQPVVNGMSAEGHPYQGFLYAGLMLTADGPKVIEFNARLGDPEAQVILPLIDEPLVPLLTAAATGSLTGRRCRLASSARVGVVLASRGYPDSSESGRAIHGIDEAERLEGVTVYHAGTAAQNGELLTAGGRVLTVAASGGSYAEAIARAYAGVERITFDGMQYRKDIGAKAIDETRKPEHTKTRKL